MERDRNQTSNLAKPGLLEMAGQWVRGTVKNLARNVKQTTALATVAATVTLPACEDKRQPAVEEQATTGEINDEKESGSTTKEPQEESSGSTSEGGETMGEVMSTGTTGIDTGDMTESTGDLPHECPPNTCLAENTDNCSMDVENGKAVPVCQCKAGYGGDKCQNCADGYENVGTEENVECAPDKTPPDFAVITTNNGLPFGFIEGEPNTPQALEGTCDGADVAKMYYSIDGGELIEIPNFDPQTNAWAIELKGLPIEQPLNYCIYTEDKFGNKATMSSDAGELPCIQITRLA